MKDKIKIHFVCQGNVHRSRIAEAYTRSLLGDNWEVTSSGLSAAKYPAGFISPWTKILSNEYGLTQYLSKDRTQTTNDILHSQNIIVFMSKDVYSDAKLKYDFDPSICITWKIKDREDWNNKTSLHDKRQKTFKTIAKHIKELIKEIDRGGWVDVVDKNNMLLGYSLPTGIASKNAVWHRGCHAIITTPNKNTLVQKRSNNIIFSPKLIDISLGGHVDASENPQDAMIREIVEEVGIKITAEQLKFLEIYKQSSYHPRYKRYTRSFIYTYHVALLEDDPMITIQKSEVSSVRLLQPQQLKRLVKYNRLKNIGRLNYTHQYYKRIISLLGY